MRIRQAGVEALLAIAKDSDRACCVFVEEVLRRAYGDRVIGAVPSARWRIILDDPAVPGVGPWEPVEAAWDAGIAEARYAGTAVGYPMPGRWHLVQGWQGTPLKSSGHTFLWWPTAAGYGERLDSADLKHRPAPSPGPELRGFLRWADVVDRYDGGLAVAVLRPTT